MIRAILYLKLPKSMMKNAVFDGIGERTMFRQKNDKKRDQLNVQTVSCKDMRMTSY